jgi:hypothetical protein
MSSLLRERDGKNYAFGILADPQYGPAPSEKEPKDMIDGVLTRVSFLNGGEQRIFHEGEARYRWALRVLGWLGVRQVVELGDLTDTNPTEKYRDAMLQAEQQSGLDIRHVIGNHDCYGAKKQQMLAQEHVMDRLGVPRPGYYTFPLGEHWQGIVLNTTDVPWHEEDITTEEQSARMDGLANNYPGNGGISREQLAWLETTCEQTASDGRHIIVFGHHPVASDRRIPYCLTGDTSAFTRILERFGVKAYLTGHDHNGSYQLEGGVQYITLRGMVNGEKRCPLALVDLAADGSFAINGLGDQPSYASPPDKPASPAYRTKTLLNDMTGAPCPVFAKETVASDGEVVATAIAELQAIDLSIWKRPAPKSIDISV